MAVKFLVIGSVLGVIMGIILVPLFLFAFPFAFKLLRPFLFYIIAALIFILIVRERRWYWAVIFGGVGVVGGVGGLLGGPGGFIGGAACPAIESASTNTSVNTKREISAILMCPFFMKFTSC